MAIGQRLNVILNSLSSTKITDRKKGVVALQRYAHFLNLSSLPRCWTRMAAKISKEPFLPSNDLDFWMISRI